MWSMNERSSPTLSLAPPLPLPLGGAPSPSPLPPHQHLPQNRRGIKSIPRTTGRSLLSLFSGKFAVDPATPLGTATAAAKAGGG